MIHYAPDHVTLLGTAADGSAMSASPMSGAAYVKMLTTMASQQQATQDNERLKATYLNDLKTYDLNNQAGRDPGLVPPKPSMVVIDDEGKTNKVAFNPPLPSPAARVVSPSMPPSAGLGGNPQGNSNALDILLSLSQQQTALLVQILNKLGG